MREHPLAVGEEEARCTEVRYAANVSDRIDDPALHVCGAIDMRENEREESLAVGFAFDLAETRGRRVGGERPDTGQRAVVGEDIATALKWVRIGELDVAD